MADLYLENSIFHTVMIKKMGKWIYYRNSDGKKIAQSKWFFPIMVPRSAAKTILNSTLSTFQFRKKGGTNEKNYR